MRSLIALTLLAGIAHATTIEAPLNYDVEKEMRQRTMIGLYVKTRSCLGTAARAILRQGVREPAIVKHFMTSMCADPFYEQLRRDGMSEDQARRTLVELTEKVLRDDVLLQPNIID